MLWKDSFKTTWVLVEAFILSKSRIPMSGTTKSSTTDCGDLGFHEPGSTSFGPLPCLARIDSRVPLYSRMHWNAVHNCNGLPTTSQRTCSLWVAPCLGIPTSGCGATSVCKRGTAVKLCLPTHPICDQKGSKREQLPVQGASGFACCEKYPIDGGPSNATKYTKPARAGPKTERTPHPPNPCWSLVGWLKGIAVCPMSTTWGGRSEA